MKTLSFLIVLLIGISVKAQPQALNGNISNSGVITSNTGITLNADSIAEIESLNDEEVRSVYEMSSSNQTIYFEFICEKFYNSKDASENFSIKITGNSNNLEAFMERYKKAKAKIIELYNQ